MKFFNTAGPVNQEEYYKLDPLHRWDLDEIMMLIQQKKYFLLHAPRQTGKTSSMLALQKYLNSEGDYTAIYANFECGQAARNDTRRAISAIIEELKWRCSNIIGRDEELEELQKRVLEGEKYDIALNAFLKELCRISPKPIVLLIDEIDSLVGDTLVSVLRQIRAGYDIRPERFPQSIVLCGVVDIKDYKIHRSDGDIITGGSCFNIKSESLRLGNFTQNEIKELYLEHTKETGQVFDDDVYTFAWHYTSGQPWLVNAIAYEACFKMKENRDRSITITGETFKTAKERLVVSRATHLDQLTDKLKEERVRNVIEPMLAGIDSEASASDKEYCFDLGLIKKTEQGFVISNDIYKEVLPRELTTVLQDNFLYQFSPDWVNKDGSINTEKLMTMFQQFWRENSDIWHNKIQGYNEAAPHLVFQGFLQRVGNGKGMIEREYGLGRRRADLYLRWKSPQKDQRIVFELKMRTEKDSSDAKYEKLISDGLKQTAEYATTCNAGEAHLIIFDRRNDISWDDKIYAQMHDFSGRKIKLWGM